MEQKETLSKSHTLNTILDDTEYYKYIFKKTEKMACAVFYILRGSVFLGQRDMVVSDLEATAQALLSTSLTSLQSTERDIEMHALSLRYALIGFESKLRIANAARFLGTDLLEVFVHEIDSVQRSLRKYIEPALGNPLMNAEVSPMPTRERKPLRIKSEFQTEGKGTVALPDGGTLIQSRREKVITVLRDKGEATIKDIMESVTDCSEKTVQRELISLIKDNVVSREGERRWSKYKLV
ncbi:MAG: hypothetical protein WAW13_04580 [Minisyncoccia bacterium]